jgi:P-type E1-E2 ATPase
MLNSEFEKQTTIDKICGELKKKVGMCGDGSNDLIAIREADIGIGVNNSDASYAATFTIN